MCGKMAFALTRMPFLLAMYASSAFGQDTTSSSVNLLDKAAKDTKVFSFDYGIPASPSLTLAGLTGAKLAPSTSLKPFVLSLPDLFGASSSVSSVAFDFAPAWAIEPEQSYSQQDYDRSPLFFRTRIGGAVYKGDTGGGDPTKSKESRVALGLSTSLLPSSDPLLVRDKTGERVWAACLNKEKSLRVYEWFSTPADRTIQALLGRFNAYMAPGGGVPTAAEFQAVESYLQHANVDISERAALSAQDRLKADLGDLQTVSHRKPAAVTALDAEAAKAIDSCQKESSDAAQHGSSIQVGAGLVMSGDAGALKNFKNPNAAVWLAARFPLGSQDVCVRDSNGKIAAGILSCWMVGGTGRYSIGEFDATGVAAKPLFKADVLDGWVGLERVSVHTMFGAYYGYLDQRADSAADARYTRSRSRWLLSGAVSLEFIQDGLWVEGSYGAARGSIDTLNDKVALLSLSLGPPKIGSSLSPQQ